MYTNFDVHYTIQIGLMVYLKIIFLILNAPPVFSKCLPGVNRPKGRAVDRETRAQG